MFSSLGRLSCTIPACEIHGIPRDDGGTSLSIVTTCESDAGFYHRTSCFSFRGFLALERVGQRASVSSARGGACLCFLPMN